MSCINDKFFKFLVYKFLKFRLISKNNTRVVFCKWQLYYCFDLSHLYTYVHTHTHTQTHTHTNTHTDLDFAIVWKDREIKKHEQFRQCWSPKSNTQKFMFFNENIRSKKTSR